MPIWQAMKGDSHFNNVFMVAEPARGKGAPRQRVPPRRQRGLFQGGRRV